MESEISEPSRQGWMRTTMSKMSKINKWADRYFVLHGATLYYYLKNTDTEPKGTINLHGACKVSDIQSDFNKKRKQFIFSITWPADQEIEERDDLPIVAPGSSSSSGDVLSSTVASKDKEKKKLVGRKKSGDDGKKEDRGSSLSGSKVAALTIGGVVLGAFTAGMGLIAGMMVVGVGAAAGGSAMAMSQSSSDREKQVFLACESYHDAELWVQAIETQLRALGDHSQDHSYVPGKVRLGFRRHAAPPEVRIEEVEEWIGSSRWRVWSVRDGLRLFEQSNYDDLPSSNGSGSGGHNGLDNGLSSVPPCLRVNISVSGSALDVFMAVMNLPPACRTGTIKSIRVVESINNYTDIVHIVLDPVFLTPTWTAPRDLCLVRYWKHNDADGSYVVCLDSTFHLDCPLLPGHVRGDLHAVYLISPPKLGSSGEEYDDDHTECLLTFIAQMDPKGWIWKMFGYQQASLQKLMMHVLDIRDCLDTERFVQVHFDPNSERDVPSKSSGGAEQPVQGTMGTMPASILSAEYWSDIDASSFRIRGRTYNQDKVKAASAPSIFKLIAIDIFDVPEPTFNIAAHPHNRVSLAHQRGEQTWVFVVNIMIPGPPYLSFVAYLEGDKSKFEEDTPFGRVARPFFNGNDDEFRNNRFKLIPKIVDGNVMIKMLVKDTPTLMGNKLKQNYYKGDNYFELDVDVGSSSVARNIVGLAIGYSKAIVVDMGFCLQGNEEDELPEVLMGGCSCIRVDCGKAKKL